MSFGARVRVSRQSRDWSQTDLANAVGTSQTCIHNWENDNTYPRPANMAALANALGVTQRFLEEGEGGVSMGVTVEEVLNSAKAELARVLHTTADRIELKFSMAS
ncbi:helix-turn-helix domain-containing protein [Rhizobium leguminosarum]|uniref:Helix-turn-helix domain-containing protein n=1 Tax=Rhizobium leguminosarum TaxID=384 RepID=A0A6P0DRF9_RHILE|nr:helix-turn-helix transcriptional regulator [Rhizobium leguminosarum]NEK54613.1 helix-turn-helix domain-containing protein [Rhizobium leguminosarum]